MQLLAQRLDQEEVAEQGGAVDTLFVRHGITGMLEQPSVPGFGDIQRSAFEAVMDMRVSTWTW